MTRRSCLAIALVLALAGPARADPVKVTGSLDATGAHLSFEWPSPVRYTGEIIDDRLILRFTRPVEASFEAALAATQRYVRSARIAGDGRTVVIELAQPSSMRTDASDRRITVDLLDKATAAAAPAAAARAPQAQANAGQTTQPTPAAPAGAASHGPTPGPVQPATPAKPGPAQAQAGAAAATPPKPADAAHALAQPPPAPATRAATAQPRSPEPARPGQATASAPTLAPPAPAHAARSPPPKAGEGGAPAVPPRPPAGGEAPVAAPTVAVTAATSADTPLPVRAEARSDGMAVRIDWPAQVSGAVFRRAGFLWAVFDQAAKADIKPIADVPQQLIAGLEQVPSASGTAIRMSILPGVNPRIVRDGNAWVLELRAGEIRPDLALTAQIQATGPQTARVFIPAQEPSDAISIKDPEVGDDIVVVPIAQLGRGMDGDRAYPQFALLATAQGLAVVPRSDRIAVKSLPDGVTISDAEGLYMTPPESLAGAGEEGAPGTAPLPAGRVFDMIGWRRGGPTDFLPRKQALQNRIAEATRITRGQPRLELAQFYFGNGLAAEAIGLLRTIEVEDPDLSARPSVKALYGACKFALGRHVDAMKDLSDPALNGRSEIELWRAATSAALSDWETATQQFTRAGTIPPGYPRNFVTEIALLGADSAIRNKDLRAAGAFLDAVNDAGPGPGEQARVDYFRARVVSAAGDYETALETWTRLAEGPDRWARVRSAMTLIDEGLARGKVTRADAIQKLDSLRFGWRGDNVELELLRRLGTLYLEEGDYRNGLTVLKQAASSFPEGPTTRQITETMTGAFKKLFLDGAATALPPLVALALYDDFRELTPPGNDGNEMIRKLADRLVSVELLDRAGGLLDRQVRVRLQGVDKARVGAQLAVIRLLDRKPDAALKAIDDSGADGVPAELARERAQLKARALLELERPDEALRLLAADDSREADLLRADITFRSQKWKEAAQVYARLVGSVDPSTARLDGPMGNLVLNWAIALSMANDQATLATVRQRFASAMERGPLREAFGLITNPSEGALNDFTTITRRFQELDRYQSFLSSYRERLKNEQLSAIN
ncbi:MAG: tetratricopeptide repeat protein [Proteobacteria bacterium]|nr:tetratricopeptide repeat protein [Pseudomonadota bacterium]MBI3497218.1 tetratricopeptide repeat protein [Pseudomonadota bacterium]